ncbi:XRE family transcriptional regulator [Brasilonema sp. CT11]|nr:XRE family transcriptional regulator [Brasilonema sp. CT11]
MGKSIKEKLKEFSPERQKKIAERANELIAEEMTRQQLRQLFKITQEQMGQILNIEQGNVSRIEQHPDLTVSTLHKYVAVMGGEFKIIAVFPSQKPISLVGFFSKEAS